MNLPKVTTVSRILVKEARNRDVVGPDDGDGLKAVDPKALPWSSSSVPSVPVAIARLGCMVRSRSAASPLFFSDRDELVFLRICLLTMPEDESGRAAFSFIFVHYSRQYSVQYREMRGNDSVFLFNLCVTIWFKRPASRRNLMILVLQEGAKEVYIPGSSTPLQDIQVLLV